MMKLTISRVDEESRVGMMITAACRPPTSGDEGAEASGQGSWSAPQGQAVPWPSVAGAHIILGPRSEGGLVQSNHRLGGRD